MHIRPATPTDLPTLTTILINAFATDPWSTLLFPPALRTQPSDEFNWRLSVTAAQLGRPGHTHLLAAAESEDGEEIIGWAHWVDIAANETSELTPTEETTAATQRASAPGMDLAALTRMREEGAVVERLAREALGEERWKGAFELHYLVIDPPHQRKGVGRLLTRALLDQAAAAEKSVWLRSTFAGRDFYLGLGFEEVGKGWVCGERQFAMVKTYVGGST